MIETIYKVEGSENKKPDINIRLPKNIKQIGQSDKDMDCQIYIEENVLSYIKQKPYKEAQIRYGVLLGEKKQGNGYTYIFINGMVEVDEVIEDSIIFSDDVWTGIYDNIRRYYKEGMILGWYASFDYDVTQDMLGIRKIHLDHFAGNNKVFLNINREEDDEAFYIYERNGLCKQPCYHVYFEKSTEFEDYIFGSGRKSDAVREKELAQKENGKYGIALNNNIGTGSGGGTSKTDNVLGKLAKEGEKLSSGGIAKVASFVTIIALAGILGVMGKNGDLDALGGKLTGFVNGILHSENSETKAGNIIAVDGVPTQQSSDAGETSSVNQAESQSATQASEQTTTENNKTEANATEGSTEQASDEKNSDESSTTINEESTKATDEASTSKVADETETTIAGETETTSNLQATISDSGSTYASYTVKSGETLYSIAMSFYGTVDMIDDIMELNNLSDENYVMEGQKILLP